MQREAVMAETAETAVGVAAKEVRAAAVVAKEVMEEKDERRLS